MYTANGSSDRCAAEEIFCSDDCVLRRVFADFALRRCFDRLKFTVCGAGDMLMTTITESFLILRRYEKTFGSFSFKAMYLPSSSAGFARRNAIRPLYQFRIEFGSFNSSATLYV